MEEERESDQSLSELRWELQRQQLEWRDEKAALLQQIADLQAAQASSSDEDSHAAAALPRPSATQGTDCVEEFIQERLASNEGLELENGDANKRVAALRRELAQSREDAMRAGEQATASLMQLRAELTKVHQAWDDDIAKAARQQAFLEAELARVREQLAAGVRAASTPPGDASTAGVASIHAKLDQILGEVTALRTESGSRRAALAQALSLV